MNNNNIKTFWSMAGNRKMDLFTFFCLYIAQSLPMTFFATALQVTMRQASFSLSAIALTQLIKLPWILKFVWAPLVDRRCNALKDFKQCILVTELIYALLILVIGQMDLLNNFEAITVLIIFSFIASATQDIATDALAVLSFKRQEKSMVNTIQSLGSFSATLIGSGVLLTMLHHYGWHRILPALALFVILAIIPLMRNKKLSINKSQSKQKINMAASWGFVKMKQNRAQIFFLLIYYMAIVSMLSIVRPWMVDLGYSMKAIGYLSGIIGSIAACCSAFVSGQLIFSLGRQRARILFASIALVAALYFVVLSHIRPTMTLITVGIILLWSSYGLSSVVVNTTAMDHVRKGWEGTDFTIQIVITHLSGIVISIISGNVAQHLGYHVFYVCTAALALLSLIYVSTIFRKGCTA